MKKRFTEEQIIPILKEAEAGVPVKELYRMFTCRFVSRPPRYESRDSTENDALTERILGIALERAGLAIDASISSYVGTGSR